MRRPNWQSRGIYDRRFMQVFMARYHGLGQSLTYRANPEMITLPTAIQALCSFISTSNVADVFIDTLIFSEDLTTPEMKQNARYAGVKIALPKPRANAKERFYL